MCHESKFSLVLLVVDVVVRIVWIVLKRFYWIVWYFYLFSNHFSPFLFESFVSLILEWLLVTWTMIIMMMILLVQRVSPHSNGLILSSTHTHILTPTHIGVHFFNAQNLLLTPPETTQQIFQQSSFRMSWCIWRFFVFELNQIHFVCVFVPRQLCDPILSHLITNTSLTFPHIFVWPLATLSFSPFLSLFTHFDNGSLKCGFRSSPTTFLRLSRHAHTTHDRPTVVFYSTVCGIWLPPLVLNAFSFNVACCSLNRLSTFCLFLTFCYSVACCAQLNCFRV